MGLGHKFLNLITALSGIWPSNVHISNCKYIQYHFACMFHHVIQFKTECQQVFKILRTHRNVYKLAYVDKLSVYIGFVFCPSTYVRELREQL